MAVLAPFPRVVLIVLDSLGCGELPDASLYGDEGSDTLGNIARLIPLRVPRLRALGLGRVARLGGGDREPAEGAYGRMAEASAGKDSVTGHWEMMGIVLDRPFPTFPEGFPASVVAEFESRIGRGTLGNVVLSGTEIIERFGAEHMQTGKPIVYTSADSVFQIAAHEAVIPVPELYRMCEIAFELVGRGMGVGRVIARPFVGSAGAFTRTANRHDYALDPTDLYVARSPHITGHPGRLDREGQGPVCRAGYYESDADGNRRRRRGPCIEAMNSVSGGLIFANFVDFDTVYGHRNDVAGYAANIERFDERLGAVLAQLRDSDLLVITADHGNDPTTPSTDHSREHVPLLMTGQRVKRDTDLGTRPTFADLGQTLAANFSVGPLTHGTSFLEDVVVEHS